MDIRVIVLVVVASLVGLFLLFAPTRGPQGELVIAQGAANQIALVNVNSGRLKTVAAGPVVHGVGVLPDGKSAYAASFGSNEVSVVDLKTQRTIAKVDVGGKSHHIMVCPHGKHVFVTVGETNAVAVIDTASNTVVAQLAVGEKPSYTVLTPDERLYVTNTGSNTVSIVDTAKLGVIATIAVGQSPDHAAVTPDGRFVYVTNKEANSVSVIDTSTQQVIATVPVGKEPHGVAATERYVYVGNRGETTLSVIDPATNQVVQTVELGTKSEHLTVSPDGKYLYIGSIANKSILVLDTTTQRAIKKIKVGSEVHQIAVVGVPTLHEHTAVTPSNPTRALTEADLTRTSKGAGIEVSVVLLNPLMPSEESQGLLRFKITLDTHTIDLSQFDLTKLAVLRTSEGVTVSEGFLWEPESESGHHRKGVLKVAEMGGGAPIITKETQRLELKLKGIGTLSRVFRWEGDMVRP
jgi:YVTN family beta-propeller protein